MLVRMTTRGEARDAILAISLNDDVADRADAAWCLVRFLGEGGVDRRIMTLARDAENTFVTEAAVEALSLRGDLAAWSLIAQAYGAEDDDHTRGHMTDALSGTVLQDWASIDEARDHLSGLQKSSDPHVRRGSIELAGWFADELGPPEAHGGRVHGLVSPTGGGAGLADNWWRRLLG